MNGSENIPTLAYWDAEKWQLGSNTAMKRKSSSRRRAVVVSLPYAIRPGTAHSHKSCNTSFEEPNTVLSCTSETPHLEATSIFPDATATCRNDLDVSVCILSVSVEPCGTFSGAGKFQINGSTTALSRCCFCHRDKAYSGCFILSITTAGISERVCRQIVKNEPANDPEIFYVNTSV